ncbi:response regulator [Leptolyngbya sp. FACHB-261]|uniref:response regulator n=1 Tax=Leptolyngbya sp. FACHB-261 TaxID=2692806 RepID=UPI001685E9F0|nr:response regulator [Leptolyngbya sp. FACHB-261]MBD2102587.1 response regulator [Leptolyngbya sp. FACHB-261]
MSSDNRTILLVEDDINDVLLIQRAFRKASLTLPQVVNNGQSALDYLMGAAEYGDRERHPLPVLILLDLKLPRLSGLEVLEWLRQQTPLRRLPVVVLTSSQENTDLQRAYDLGVNSYLLKPVGFESLLETVKALNIYWLTLNRQPDLD